MQNKSKAWFLLIILSIIWGSSFILMKRGLEAYSSNEVAALRIGIAFLFLSPLLIKHYKINLKKYWFGLLIMGFAGNFIPAFLFTKAETEISSSLAGMLNALTPLFTIIIASFWLKLKPNGMQVSGIIVGLIAAAALMYFDSNNESSKNALYSLLIIGATICYAVAVTGIKKYLNDVNPVQATVWAFTFTGPVSLIYLFGFSDFTEHFQNNPASLSSLGYLTILAVVGTALSVIAYNVLIREAGAVFASTCTYLIPVVAIMWGLFDSENVNWMQFLSILIIIFSVYLINRPKASGK
ncbi:MAG: EamA family transporter [Bacteroidetes bacterium]|jgi:drug/metabolite transporter (DMT)-like permease|nr:EamA family transporter [Bacteroidota bacterium]